jgi:hypothetical protein
VRLPKPATSQWPQKKCSLRESWSLIIPNVSTQEPPTSSAVQINLGNSFAVTKSSLGTELEARLLPAIRSSFDLRHPSCQLFPLKGHITTYYAGRCSLAGPLFESPTKSPCI